MKRCYHPAPMRPSRLFRRPPSPPPHERAIVFDVSTAGAVLVLVAFALAMPRVASAVENASGAVAPVAPVAAAAPVNETAGVAAPNADSGLAEKSTDASPDADVDTDVETEVAGSDYDVDEDAEDADTELAETDSAATAPADSDDADTATASVAPEQDETEAEPVAPAIPRVLPVTVVLQGNAQAHAAVVAQAIESALNRSTRLQPIDPLSTFDPVGVGARTRQEERGIDALIHGRKAFDSLELGLGLESFERAISAFEESALWKTFPKLVEAMVLRLVVRWSEDYVRPRQDIERLVSLAPNVEFPPDITPGDLQEEVQRAKQRYAAQRKYALDINSTPVAASVYVNGIYRGTAPVTVRGLTEGEHYVSLVAPGYVAEQKRARAGPGSAFSVHLKQAERSNPYHTFVERILEHFGKESELPHAQTLARIADADQLLVAGVSRDRGRVNIALHRVDRRDGHVHAIEEIQLAETDDDFADRAEAVALRVLGTDRSRGSKGEPRTFKSGLALFAEAITPTESTVKIGTLVLSGALLVAGGTVGFLAHQQHETFRTLPQRTNNLEATITAGRQTALLSDILIGLGLAAGGTWAYLEFGTKYAKKTSIPDAPLFDQRRPEAPPPPADADDPFASLTPSTPAAPTLEELVSNVSVFATPAQGGGVLGLKGSF